MAEQRFMGRIVQKHDSEKNWLAATSFVPMQGEIICYDTDEIHNYERFKIGDGVTPVNDLPFNDDALNTTVESMQSAIDTLEEAVLHNTYPNYLLDCMRLKSHYDASVSPYQTSEHYRFEIHVPANYNPFAYVHVKHKGQIIYTLTENTGYSDEGFGETKFTCRTQTSGVSLIDLYEYGFDLEYYDSSNISIDPSTIICAAYVRFCDANAPHDAIPEWWEIDPSTIVRIGSIPTDYVSHSEQSLTDTQKEQARNNIGALPNTYSPITVYHATFSTDFDDWGEGTNCYYHMVPTIYDADGNVVLSEDIKADDVFIIDLSESSALKEESCLIWSYFSCVRLITQYTTATAMLYCFEKPPHSSEDITINFVRVR